MPGWLIIPDQNSFILPDSYRVSRFQQQHSSLNLVDEPGVDNLGSWPITSPSRCSTFCFCRNLTSQRLLWICVGSFAPYGGLRPQQVLGRHRQLLECWPFGPWEHSQFVSLLPHHANPGFKQQRASAMLVNPGKSCQTCLSCLLCYAFVQLPVVVVFAEIAC